MDASGTVILLGGVSFGAYLLWTARHTKPAAAQEDRSSRWSYTLLTILGCALLVWNEVNVGVLGQPFLLRTAVSEWIGAALAALGFGFAAWARYHLGVYWSASVGLKHDHRIISSGPYKYFRHPMYVGLVAAACGMALWRDVWGAVAGAILFTVGLWRKSRIENRWLAGTRATAGQPSHPLAATEGSALRPTTDSTSNQPRSQ